LGIWTKKKNAAMAQTGHRRDGRGPAYTRLR